VLGHVQRGGTPTAFDRALATRMGGYAVEMVARRAFGRMVALQGTALGSVTLASAVRHLKTVDPKGEEVRTARRIGVSFAAADGSDDRHDRSRARHGAP
jgi:6-phosphofructokinase 1